MTSALLIGFLVFFLAILFQGLFAGYETGFILSKANPIRVRHLAEAERQPRAIRLAALLDNTEVVLTMLLIGTNLGTIAGTVALTRGLEMIDSTGLLAVVIATPFVMIFAEIMPKSIFQRHPVSLSLALVGPIRFFHFVFAPISYPVAGLIRVMQRMAGANDPTALSPLMSSLEDLRKLVDESAERGTLEADEQRMIHSVMDLREKPAREVMLPRIDIQGLPLTGTRDELVRLFAETGRSRIVLYEDSVDHAVGVVNVYDVLLDTEAGSEGVERFMRPVKHVPDSIKIGDLLREMLAEQHHIALVTDEYGGTDGLITVEDILEEIFGDIQDEHDSEERQLIQVGENSFVVDARLPLHELNERTGLSLHADGVETFGGWVTTQAGHIPVKAEVIEVEGLRATVLDAGVTHVSKIRLEITPASGNYDDTR